MAKITSADALRRVIPEPRATTRVKILPTLDEQAIEFLKRCPFALISTVGADGKVEVSPKGDEPGFIRVEDPSTLLIPERAGNNLAFGLLNILATAKIGLIALGDRQDQCYGDASRAFGRLTSLDPDPTTTTYVSAKFADAAVRKPYRLTVDALREQTETPPLV